MEEQYLNLLKRRQEECALNVSNLIKDDRQDEANLEKVKENIYEVFQTLYHATKKQAKSEEEFIALYQKRFDTIPANWIKRLELAREHDDIATVVIEEIKLNVVDEIRNSYLQLFMEDKKSIC